MPAFIPTALRRLRRVNSVQPDADSFQIERVTINDTRLASDLQGRCMTRQAKNDQACKNELFHERADFPVGTVNNFCTLHESLLKRLPFDLIANLLR